MVQINKVNPEVPTLDCISDSRGLRSSNRPHRNSRHKKVLAAPPTEAPMAPPAPISCPALEEGLPSRGSKNHACGQCRPCKLYSTPEGCRNGSQCNFCHFEHGAEKHFEAAIHSSMKQLKRSFKKQDGATPTDDGSDSTTTPPSPTPLDYGLPESVAGVLASAFGDEIQADVDFSPQSGSRGLGVFL